MATIKITFDNGETFTTTREGFPLTGDALLTAVRDLTNDMIEEGRPFTGFEDENGKHTLINVARVRSIEEVEENESDQH